MTVQFIFALFAVVACFLNIYCFSHIHNASLPVESGYASFVLVFFHSSQYESTWCFEINILVESAENEETVHLMHKHLEVSFLNSRCFIVFSRDGPIWEGIMGCAVNR